jgi:hypothetical protein
MTTRVERAGERRESGTTEAPSTTLHTPAQTLRGIDRELSARRLHNEFVTLFDVRYLTRGLVLYESLARSCAEFRLRVLCMDHATREVLDTLRLPSLVPTSLEELEAHDPELSAARQTRSHVEYCWTAVSALCLYCLERERELSSIAYVDADVMFYADPRPAFDELGAGSVLLTAHRYAERWRWLERDSGPYNVQLVAFRRDPEALGLLRWWRERCIEWCYDRVEDGRFGDQRYLDHWPDHSAVVRVLSHSGAGLGPWSAGRVRLDATRAGIHVNDEPLLFHHFHGLRIYRPGRYTAVVDRGIGAQPIRFAGRDARWASVFPLSELARTALWQPYVSQLALQTDRVLAVAPHLRPSLEPASASGLARRLALRAPRPLPAIASRGVRATAAIASRNRGGNTPETVAPRAGSPWQAPLSRT